jgi:Protein of unknown function (DUF2917)
MQDIPNDRLNSSLYRRKLIEPGGYINFACVDRIMKGIAVRINLNGSGIHLERGRLIALDPAVRTRVTVLRGRLWITQDGNPRDYEVSANESFSAATTDRLVIHAEDDSELAIYEPQPSGWLYRLIERFGDRYGRFAAFITPASQQRCGAST